MENNTYNSAWESSKVKKMLKPQKANNISILNILSSVFNGARMKAQN